MNKPTDPKPIQHLTTKGLIDRYHSANEELMATFNRHVLEQKSNVTASFTELASTAVEAWRAVTDYANVMREIRIRALKPMVVSSCKLRNAAKWRKDYILPRLRRRYRKVFKSLAKPILRNKLDRQSLN